MAKKSAKEELIARIEADMERVAAVANYVGGDGTPQLTDRMNADLARFQGMLNYVAAAVPASVTDAPKPKRGRGPNKKKPGLPAATAEQGTL